MSEQRYPRAWRAGKASQQTGHQVVPAAPVGLAVLFVDPDRSSVLPLAHAIHDRYATAIVASAREAYDSLALRLPTIVVTELRLPDMDGLHFIASVRNSPQTRHVLVMVVSTSREIRDRIAAFQEGADDYLIKPVDLQAFVTHLRSIVTFRQTAGVPLSLTDTTWKW